MRNLDSHRKKENVIDERKIHVKIDRIMEKLMKQLIRKYAILQATYWISQCVIGGFAVVFLHAKNFDNTQIGIVLSVASILSIIMQLMVSSFADKSKKISLRYIVIGLMFIVFALGLILLISPYSFLVIAVSYIFIMALQSTLNPLFNSLAVEYINQGVPMNYGFARGMGSIAYAITSYVMGIYVTSFGTGSLFLIFLICYCLVIVSAFTFKIRVPKSTVLPAQIARDEKSCSEKEYLKQDAEGKKSPEPTSLLRFFIKYKKFSLQLIGIALLFYSQNIIYTYLINIIENVGGNSTDLGISLAITAAVELPTMVGFIFIVRKFKCSTLIKVSAFFFLVKAGVVWLAPNILIIHFSQVLQMLAYALFIPASVYYVNAIIEEQDKVKGQAMLGVAMCVAGTIANISGGKMLDTIGVKDMLLLGTIVTACGFIIVCFSTQKVKGTVSS